MADSDIDLISSFVWGESSGLSGSGDEPDKVLDRLWSDLAYIAIKARPLGLLGQMKRAGKSVGTEEAANYNRMRETVKKVVEEKYDGQTLPQQAALWQIDADGRLLFDTGDNGQAPPSWIFKPTAAQAGEFSSKAGTRFRLYELKDPAVTGQLGYVSSYSSTGLAVRQWTVPTLTRRIAWGIGVAASILFILGGVLAKRTGEADGAIRTKMANADFQYDIVLKLANNCINDQKLFPKWKRGACSFLQDGDKYVMPRKVEEAEAARAKEAQAKGIAVQAAAAVVAAPTATPTAAPSATPTVAPTPTGTATPTPTTTPAPTAAPTATPSAVPTAAPSVPPAPSQNGSAKSALASEASQKDVREFGDVGATIALIRKCLNVGLAAPPAEDKPAGTPDADAAAAAADQAASCELIARSAGNLVPVKADAGFLNNSVAMLFGAKLVAGTRSILLQLLLTTIGIAGLAIALGLGTKGRVDGIWIDERNRVSLARAQVTLWTIVALGGFATIALYNVGLGAPVAFPQIPASIAAALGIAFAAPMISALILKTKGLEDVTTVGASARDAKDFGGRGDFLTAAPSGLETRADPTQASIADVFMGEKVTDAGNVDISRLQNVVLTVTLVLGYFAMLTGQLRAISPDSILSGLDHLPDPGAAFTAVLLVSHATYLGTKAYTTAGPASTDKPY
ncbi:hypothetical protein [Bradyrhizobium sp. HKCCYLR20261]|uniref:hypothetical protein n=1 Tax=Bradyrhizobium sp. HKCCYLR20261 TaxID=3420760 RepID=UPI003EBC7597